MVSDHEKNIEHGFREIELDLGVVVGPSVSLLSHKCIINHFKNSKMGISKHKNMNGIVIG